MKTTRDYGSLSLPLPGGRWSLTIQVIHAMKGGVLASCPGFGSTRGTDSCARGDWSSSWSLLVAGSPMEFGILKGFSDGRRDNALRRWWP